ncbi:sulfate transporter [Desulfosporosinus sp. Tol-M]|nr:sulfate transporter [Desulfosporosinus sp. Tol-M]
MPKTPTTETKQSAQKPLGNRYNRLEWAGAFGDLGTLIPFITGYILIMKLDPLGILFMFGILLISSGLYYKTPVPIQPMKAIGGAAIAQATAITPGMVWGAGIFTGFFWLILGLTGTLNYVSKIVTKPVKRGIILGLGILFIIEGTKLMKTDLVVALIALVITFLLLTNKHIPAMFVLIVFGITAALVQNPGLFKELAAIHPSFRLPQFSLGHLTWSEFLKGTLVLGIPQIPLTLGNAVIAITAENNRLFPEHPVTEKKMAISQGIMNLISPIFGGIPICHGAGGMAGHVRFGARTGGSLIILGGILLTVGLCFSSSVLILANIFPSSVLGVMLFFAGLELAVSARDVGHEKSDFYILLVTAGFSLWNMGIGFIAGLVMQEMLKRKIFKV